MKNLKEDDDYQFFCAKPVFRLAKSEDEKNIPTTALSWSPFNGGSTIAAVSASGIT